MQVSPPIPPPQVTVQGERHCRDGATLHGLEYHLNHWLDWYYTVARDLSMLSADIEPCFHGTHVSPAKTWLLSLQSPAANNRPSCPISLARRVYTRGQGAIVTTISCAP
jgi:hypothetical protein